MTNYGNTTNLGYILSSVSDSVSSNQKTYALNSADNWINSQIAPITGTTPALIQQAAEYFAAAFLLRMLYDTDSEEAQTAVWYEKQANDTLSAYIAQNDITEYDSPYSSRLTPSRVFSKEIYELLKMTMKLIT
jgi:hypothetical protein